MTYEEFMTGLYAKYHYVPDRSIFFIPANKNKGGEGVTFQDIVALKVDAERVLATIKNRNMVEALELIAQGHLEEYIARELKLRLNTVERYPWMLKRHLLELDREFEEKKKNK
jgi:hypothetical protein